MTIKSKTRAIGWGLIISGVGGVSYKFGVPENISAFFQILVFGAVIGTGILLVISKIIVEQEKKQK